MFFLYRTSFIDVVLTGLLTIQPLSPVEDENNENSLSRQDEQHWNIYETCSLNFKCVLDNFAINKDLWSMNDMKLNELFNQGK
jgi:hypothetical protein